MKKNKKENILEDLTSFEESLAQKIPRMSPNIFFQSALKDRLKSSKIYQRRREIGATWVLSLGLSLIFVSVAAIIYTTIKPRILRSS